MYIDVQLHPTKDEGGAYKLGIWVRDNAQGLGTITFLNADSEYGALGHGIHDVDTGKLIEMSTGRLYDTSIQNIKKVRTEILEDGRDHCLQSLQYFRFDYYKHRDRDLWEIRQD